MLIENFTNNYDVNNRNGDTSLLFLGGYKKSRYPLKKADIGTQTSSFPSIYRQKSPFQAFSVVLRLTT